MIFKGLKFGLLLQFAVGPVCIFIFQIASTKGFCAALSAVAGVVIIDGLFILAAVFGIAALIERKNIKIALKIFGVAVLFFFGVSTILGAFNIRVLPGLDFQNGSVSNAFLRAVILTMSNPLTILFWAGVFSAKIAEENMGRGDVYRFGLGALLSSVVFLSLISVLGSLTHAFLPPYIMNVLNIAVGLLLIFFSIRMAFKKV